MKFVRMHYKLFIVLLAFWFLLTLNITLENIIIGVILSLMVTLATHNVLYDENGFLYRGINFFRLIKYLGVLFIEIFKASFRYIFNLLSHRYEPVIFKVELDLVDPMQVGIIANSITLTPGTITVDIVGSTIFVMTLAKPGTDHALLAKPIKARFEHMLKSKEDKS
ncbi:MAG: hypothetical protein EA375_06295 [Acholeplasmataceae bacterium]|nr:MAG: hypothetical protein EA375_06295 [Acholeplasmataceae bacterium]